LIGISESQSEMSFISTTGIEETKWNLMQWKVGKESLKKAHAFETSSDLMGIFLISGIYDRQL